MQPLVDDRTVSVTMNAQFNQVLSGVQAVRRWVTPDGESGASSRVAKEAR